MRLTIVDGVVTENDTGDSDSDAMRKLYSQEKYAGVWTASEVLINNITKGTSTDPRHHDRLRDRSQARLMKKANGSSLTAQEQLDEDWYDSYLDWADLVRDEAQTACDAVEQLSSPEDVIAYDVSVIVWPVFTP